jgi:3-oxoacyl-[acyl-carrier protein] reductase
MSSFYFSKELNRMPANAIAIVTGVSHEAGIGAAICRRLAQESTSIFFTYWKASTNWKNDFETELQQIGARCNSLEIDLADENAASIILDQVELKLGMPNILVNNAAHSTRDGYRLLDGQTLDLHYQVNVRTPCLLSVEFAKRLEQSTCSNGRIIHLISGQALGPMPDELAYVATKGALSAFTLTLSAEVAPLGITVNAVNPGPTDTGWMTDELRAQMESKFPLGRVGQPEDAARLIAFLASEEASWITGQVIHSEGGFLRN